MHMQGMNGLAKINGSTPTDLGAVIGIFGELPPWDGTTPIVGQWSVMVAR